MELLVLTVVLSEEERDALQDAGYSGYLAELQADEALLRLEEREQVVEAKRLSTPVELTRTATGLEAIYERARLGLLHDPGRPGVDGDGERGRRDAAYCEWFPTRPAAGGPLGADSAL